MKVLQATYSISVPHSLVLEQCSVVKNESYICICTCEKTISVTNSVTRVVGQGHIIYRAAGNAA
jgi:hypothetical protein